MKGCEPHGAPRGPVDFTGYWALVRTEGMDNFLKAAGFPWVVRKAALRFGGSAVDVIAHSATSMRVTSLNAKGSWTRWYNTEWEVSQRNAEGTAVRTSSWWEGRVFRSRMEGSELGVLESWRYLHGTTMAVRTSLRLAPRAAHAANGGIGSHAATPGQAASPTQAAAAGSSHAAAQQQQQGGQEAVMFWFFDRMETLQRHVAAGGVGGSLLQQIETDQRRVERATRTDTAYIQDVLLDWQRWQSPADEFIQLASPPPLSRAVHRKRRSLGSMSPASMSKSPSNDSLAALPAGLEVRSDARSMRSDNSRSRLAESELSAAGLDRAARQAAALALGPPEADAASPRSPLGGAHASQQQQAAAAAAGGKHREEGGDHGYAREATLSYPRSEGGQIPVAEARSEGGGGGPAVGPADSLTFRAPVASAPRSEPEPAGPSSTSARMASPPPVLPYSLSGAGSDAATRGSIHGSMAGSGGLPSGPQHMRSASGGSAAQRSVHYKSMSTESVGRASTPGRASPRSTPTGHHTLTPSEQVMAFRLHEFGDSRGIASVVPVMSPNDTTEPQLLSMSPEQAEETAAKLRELESDMMLRRQENRRGWSLCGCFVVTLASDTLPDHLRVWESRLT